MDPFTISTGVLACISISLKVLVGLEQLKANIGGGSIGSASIDALADEISGLRQVLESMEDAFQGTDGDRLLRETGHAGTHWRNLRRCLNDEHGVLSDFDEMLFDLIKKVKVLAPSRMKSRLQSAAARFVLVGQQVQAYKDTFKVSLDVLVLSKSVSPRNPAPEVDSSVRQDVQRSMASVEVKIKALEDAVAESTEAKTVDAVAKLKQCVTSAMSLFSSAPTKAPAKAPAKADSKAAESLPPSRHDGVMEWISSVDGERLQTPPSEDSGFESASPQTTATQLPTRKLVDPGASSSGPPTPAASPPSPATSPASISDAPANHGHSVHHHSQHGVASPQHPTPGPVIMYMSPVGWQGQNQSHNSSSMGPMFPVQVIYGPPPSSSHHQRASFQQPATPLRSPPPPPTPATQRSQRPNSASTPSLPDPNPRSQPKSTVRPQPKPQQQPQKRPELQPPPKVQPKLQLRTEQLAQPRSQVRSLPASIPRPQPSYGNTDEGSEPGPVLKQRAAKLQKQPRGTGKVQAEKGDRLPGLDAKSRFSLGQPISAKRKSQNRFTGLRRLMPGSGDHLPRRQKLCFIGDSGCGKTCLLTAATKGTFPEPYEPTTFENYVSDVDVRNIGRMELEIWDTAGQEIYDNLRALSYPDSQALVLCFSIGDPQSYHNLLEKWLPEATRFCPETPIFVIGCKQDLRFDPKTIGELQKSGQLPLTTAEGLAAAGRAGAKYYIETSAKGRYGIDSLLVIIAEEIQMTAQLEPVTSLARRFHEDARVINEERRNLRATGEILTPREKEYASRYTRVVDKPSSTVWKLQADQIVDKVANASRSGFFRKSS